MAKLQVPTTCGGITLVTSGALVPASNQVTCTASEITDIIQSYNQPSVVSSNATTGEVVLRMSKQITSITLNGNVYAVTDGVSAVMSAVDATELYYQKFQLITG